MKSFSQQALTGIAVVASLLCLGTMALANGKMPSESKRLTLMLKAKPLREALAEFKTASGIKVELEPDVLNVPITLNIQDLPAEKALQAIFRQVVQSQPKLALTRDGADWRIGQPKAPKPAEISDAPEPKIAVAPDSKISFDFREVPLRTAIDRIFRGTGYQYSIDPNVPNVRITLKAVDVSLQQGLRLIIREAAKQVPGLTQSKG